MKFQKHFTLEQASDMLPTVRLLLHHIQEIARPTLPDELAPGPDSSSAIPQSEECDPAVIAKTAPLLPLFASLDDRRKAIDDIHRSILEQGIVIQDVQRGLIDFPAIIDGREVFLCYELQDGDKITHYHEIDAGYAGRKPLEGTF